ncbi:MAG: peptidylprolyl isomerase [Pseudomonadales bacterium]
MRIFQLIGFITAFIWSAYATADNPIVTLETSKGNIEITLFEEQAPVTVKNFLSYVDKGFYEGTIFHRVISNFMIQTGGFDVNMEEKKAGKPIINESKNRLHNDRGTVAMARTSDPDSATAQFYVNVRMNSSLDWQYGQAGYTVFGEVSNGMHVVNEISIVQTAIIGGMEDVPLQQITVNKAYRGKAK